MIQLYRNQGQHIENFTIYGERNSGTKYLEKCFTTTFGLSVTYFYGWKHFFGWTRPSTITYKGKHTLFIGTVRSPYEWILSMMNSPHHIPWENKQSLESLLYNEWYSINEKGQEIIEDRNFKTIDCNYYEIQKNTAQKYKNIFELRTIKNKYLFEEMPNIACNFVLLSYDSFILNHKNYLNIISNRFNLPILDEPTRPIIKPPKLITSEHIHLIEPYLDWTSEASLGYFKQEPSFKE